MDSIPESFLASLSQRPFEVLWCLASHSSHVRGEAKGRMGRPCFSVISVKRSLMTERSQVDDEAVFHITFQHALVSLVDLLNGDDLDVGDDPVLGAEVEQLLGLRDAAD